MTSEEAILWMRVLKHSKINWAGEKAEDEEIIARCEEAEQEAFDMAIKALSERNIARDIATILENEQDMRVILKNADREDTVTLNSPISIQAEMVAVVRCKDCRHRDLFSCPLADNDFQKDEDFCSWGEKREEVNGFKSVGQAWNTSQGRWEK